ncbi:hypothetical protein SAMN05192552_103514 [Natrinema hispanicum]|uniref:Uncharacterized protein n=1 Tax=Natrinema hispanicum TaxID=392421 RepID=A0A1G6WB81_9EURY|nr:hypothetical protein SAMN05192552_103514 [Natrinema hispanicum]SEU09402.1 hypothetical protein SAMN04488694_14215 [Natrinema hispanicum]
MNRKPTEGPKTRNNKSHRGAAVDITCYGVHGMTLAI